MSLTRQDCIARDAADPLAPHRNAFALPDGVIYLDGNSLGTLPRATPARLREVVEREWGEGLIRSWNAAGWIDAPRRVGAKIARLIGAKPAEVICADSTSINLFKALAAALALQAGRPQVSTNERRVVLSERGNFPTDLYIAQGLAELLGGRHALKLVGSDEVAAALDERVAVLMLTHVNYRTGAMHEMAALTRRAHDAGALVIWDLAHSAGAVPVDLNAAGADFAVGCGYKYLNGGPGAPAFAFVAERHLAALAEQPFAQPLSGWIGHRAPFDFDPDYAPARGIDRFAVGTPSILALAALDCGVDTVLAAGVDALRAKSVALTELFIALVEARCAKLGLDLVTPRDASRRGSQVSLRHEHAWPVMQALVARGVIGDFRAPDILRFGFAPLYVRFVDVWDAVEALRDVLATGAWDRPEFKRRKTVT
ncbi:MAG: kynureninase [Burkholderiaceae bacterium]